MSRYQVKVWFTEEDRDEGFASYEWSGDNLDEAVETADDYYSDGAEAVEVETVMVNQLVYHISVDEDTGEDYVEDNLSDFI